MNLILFIKNFYFKIQINNSLKFKRNYLYLSKLYSVDFPILNGNNMLP